MHPEPLLARETVEPVFRQRARQPKGRLLPTPAKCSADPTPNRSALLETSMAFPHPCARPPMISSNVQVERRAAAQTEAKLLYVDSSSPSDGHRRRGGRPLQRKLGLLPCLAKTLGHSCLPTGPRCFPTLDDIRGQSKRQQSTRIWLNRSSPFLNDHPSQHLVSELWCIIIFVTLNNVRVDTLEVRAQGATRGALFRGHWLFSY